jgi:hypothetical protein
MAKGAAETSVPITDADMLPARSEESGQDLKRLVGSLEEEQGPRAGNDLQRCVGDAFGQQPAALARDDAIVVAGEDERRCSDLLQTACGAVSEHSLDLSPVAGRILEPDDEPLTPHTDDIPRAHALMGFGCVRAFGADREREHRLLTEIVGFTMTGPGAYAVEGGRRHASYIYDQPRAVGLQAAGTVHHIAWCDRDDEHALSREQLIQAGAAPTPIIDRQSFLSIYFREPGGVLSELATTSPGFAVDEDPEHLGEELRLPPQHEHLRDRLERSLRPRVNPRVTAPAAERLEGQA